MGFLSSTDQYCDERGVIVPWKYDEHFVDEWNKVADQLKFRAYVDKSTRYASRKRLSQIIEANAALLGGSRRTSKDVLAMRFCERFILACDYLKATVDNDAHGLEVLGTQYQKTMGVWQWLRPDLKAIVFLAGLQCGQDDAIADLEQDKQRRQAKAAAIKRLAAHWQETERKIAYLLRDPESILMLEPALTSALAQVESEVEFLAESNGP
nr:hypothetical protein 7 [bacterium]